MDTDPPRRTIPAARLALAEALHAYRRAEFSLAPTLDRALACVLSGVQLDAVRREVMS